MTKPEIIHEKRHRFPWTWAVGALVAVFFASALISSNFPIVSLFDRSNKLCQCAQVPFLPGVMIYNLPLKIINSSSVLRNPNTVINALFDYII